MAAGMPNTPSPPKHIDKAFKVELAICLCLAAVFGWMFYRSYEWDIEAALFPRLISSFGIVSILAYVSQITLQNLKGQDLKGGRILDIPWAKIGGDAWAVKRTATGVICSVLAFWLSIWVFGFHIAAPVYLYSQMVIYGGVRKWISAFSGVVCLLVIILVYDQLAETTWNDPLFFDFVKFLFQD